MHRVPMGSLHQPGCCAHLVCIQSHARLHLSCAVQQLHGAACRCPRLICRLPCLLAVQELQLDVSFGGMVIAAVSVVSSGLQQIFVRTMQQKHKLSAHELLSNTAPVQVRRLTLNCDLLLLQKSSKGNDAWCALCQHMHATLPVRVWLATVLPGTPARLIASRPPQAWSLLLVGPFIDKLASNEWVYSYSFTRGAAGQAQVWW